jgi:ParB family chromosome partitioning protein
MKNFAKLLGINAPDKEEEFAPTNTNETQFNFADGLQEPQDLLKPQAQDASGLKVFDPPDYKQSEVKKIPSELILPNPFQPRKTFNQESLDELALSIKEYGIIQPLLVRAHGEKYQLIAGERRLRASKIAGLSEVPVIVRYMDDKEIAELAMIENLQREDLHFWEEAEGFAKLIADFNITQETLAKRMGKSQSFIANKMRLLKLPEKTRQKIFDQNLTERHARAILKVDDEAAQLEIVELISQKKLNVRQTEEFIEKYLAAKKESPDETPKQKMMKIVKDVRIFINTINSVAKQMKNNGMDVDYQQDFDGEYVTITMKMKNTKRN